jgi:hypothetical protein
VRPGTSKNSGGILSNIPCQYPLPDFFRDDYLIIYFVYKTTKEALIVSAREMTKKEKRTYAEK